MSHLDTDRDIPSLTGLRFIAAMSVTVAHGSALMFRPQWSQVPIAEFLAWGAGFGVFSWPRFAKLYPLFVPTNAVIKTVRVPAEAGLGGTAFLSCAKTECARLGVMVIVPC